MRIKHEGAIQKNMNKLVWPQKNMNCYWRVCSYSSAVIKVSSTVELLWPILLATILTRERKMMKPRRIRSARETMNASNPGQRWVLQSNILISGGRQWGGSVLLWTAFRPPPQVWEHSPSLHSLHWHETLVTLMLSVSVQTVRFLYFQESPLRIRKTSLL